MRDLIPKFVIESIVKLEENEYEMSLGTICNAIDATARKEYTAIKKDGERFREFINDNMQVVTKASTGLLTCEDIVFNNIYINDADVHIGKGQPDISLADIVYLVRCSYSHEAILPQKLIFTDEIKIASDDQSITLPKSLVYGLLLAVVGAKSNIYYNTQKNLSINFKNRSVPLNSLWGQKKKIEQYLQED